MDTTDTTAHCPIYFVCNFHQFLNSCTIDFKRFFVRLALSIAFWVYCQVQGCSAERKDIGNEIPLLVERNLFYRKKKFHLESIFGILSDPLNANCDNGKQQNWMKYKTSLFSRTNLLKVNVMLKGFFACLGDAARRQIAHDKPDANSSPADPKWIWNAYMSRQKFNFRTQAEGCRLPLRCVPTVCNICAVGLQKTEKCEQDSLMHLCSMFSASEQSRDHQINVCKLVWGGDTNDKWLHGCHCYSQPEASTKVRKRTLQFDHHTSHDAFNQKFKRLPLNLLINFLQHLHESGLCVCSTFLWWTVKKRFADGRDWIWLGEKSGDIKEGKDSNCNNLWRCPSNWMWQRFARI